MQPAPEPRFVGRAPEIAALRAWLLSSRRRGGLLVVSGDAGIGKSALISKLCDLAAADGVPAARGHAVADAGAPPLWVWSRLARSLPQVGQVLDGAGGPGAVNGDPDAVRFAMFEAVAEGLRSAAAPDRLLLVLEDLHWADRSSLLLLQHVTRELDGSGVLVAVTFRTPAGPELAAALPDLLRAAGSRVITLSGLTDREVQAWLRAATAGSDDEGAARRLRERTGGNPLYLRLLIEAAAAAGDRPAELADPPELLQLALGRTAVLADDVRELLAAASVLGERLDVPVLAEVVDRPLEQVQRGLDQALRHGVLRAPEQGDGAMFSHALVRDAVYDSLAPSRRSVLHASAARALQRRVGDRSPDGHADGLAALIAGHWLRAGGPDGAANCLQWSRRAAAAARSALAYDEAAHFAQLAYDSAQATVQAPAEQIELLLEWAESLFLAGRIDQAVAQTERAARLAEPIGRPDLLVRAALVVHGVGDPQAVVSIDRLCVRALELVPADQPALRARLLARRALVACDLMQPATGRELSALAVQLARGTDDADAELDAIRARHLAISEPGGLAERVELSSRAIELAQRTSQPLAGLWGHIWLVDAAFQRADLAAVDAQLSLIERVAQRGGLPVARWHLTRLRATRAAFIGDFAAARELNRSARELAERSGDFSAVGMFHAFCVQLATVCWQPADLPPDALAVMARADHLPLVRVSRVLALLVMGDRGGAAALFGELRRIPRTLEVGPRWAATVGMVGFAAVLLDDAEVAGDVYDRMRGLDEDFMCDGSGAVFCGGAVARPLGDLALAVGRVDEALAHYETAVRLNDEAGARPYAALSRLGVARALLARHATADIAAAQRSAQLAAAEFRRLDMPGQLAFADELLLELSASSRTGVRLSAREQQVADLIAQALTNRDIAARLVLSERTVESHVSNILAKLGFSGRTEIATWAQARSQL